VNIFTFLEREHQEVIRMFNALEDTSIAAVKKRQQIFAELSTLLELHTAVEEIVLYTPLKSDSKSRPKILEAYEEHSLARTLLHELTDLPASHEHWLPKLMVLRENIEHHLKKEESELFPLAKKVMKPEDLEKMGEEFIHKRREVVLRYRHAS